MKTVTTRATTPRGADKNIKKTAPKVKNAYTGCLYTIVAPSGAGKSSLVAALLEKDPAIRLSISTTTRPARPGEISGREYYFVTREKFEELSHAGEFLEQAEVYGNLYGTSKHWIEATRAAGEDVLLEIDWQGARQVKRIFPDMSLSIFCRPPLMCCGNAWSNAVKIRRKSLSGVLPLHARIYAMSTKPTMLLSTKTLAWL